MQSEKHFLREALKEFTIKAVADAHGLLVRPFRSNKAEDMDWIYSRKVSGGFHTFAAYGNKNVSTIETLRNPNGSVPKLNDGSGRDLNLINLAQSIIENPNYRSSSQVGSEKWFLEQAVDMMMQEFTHTGVPPGYKRGIDPDPFVVGSYGDPPGIVTKGYGEIFSQNPDIPPAIAFVEGNQGGSPLTTTYLTALVRSVGMLAQNDMSFGLKKERTVMIKVSDRIFYASGNTLFKRVFSQIAPCAAFTASTDEYSNLLAPRSDVGYPNALCNFN